MREKASLQRKRSLNLNLLTEMFLMRKKASLPRMRSLEMMLLIKKFLVWKKLSTLVTRPPY